MIVSSAGEGEHARAWRLERALLAVAEALFFMADQKRDGVDRVRMPTHSGETSEEEIERFVVDRVSPWIDGKQTLILEAEEAYAKIAALEPQPPPRWVARAAARIGHLRGKFAAELRAAPIPAAWQKKGRVPGQADLTWEQVRATYFRAIDRRSAPLVDRARMAYESCESLAAKLAYDDEYTRTCTAWLDTRR
jgi:hypothetical protein